ncbi:MAG: TIGR03936 family radical SAM-associated protein [Defluviitaleaceae bacterium]|nr:TIGR03936 family radical SAM-associated protein [Defluviitaleaceae bacterium]MCL2275967.1 TIGR03936 family radical SAM-associated protein [Defluviitaleaceae bacterium]
MVKVRIQFSKDGALRFIGHLDFLRVFGQMLRRAELPVAFSQGFNPHILLSFALPLPLGMVSGNDYADLTLAHQVNLLDAVKVLQTHAPQGLTLHKIWETEGRNTASVTATADYTLAGEIVTDLLASQEYIIPKKTKSGVKDTNIRPDIFDITETKGQITLRLAAGSGRFLNPVTTAKILLNREVSAHEITRAELYARVGEAFIPLDKFTN